MKDYTGGRVPDAVRRQANGPTQRFIPHGSTDHALISLYTKVVDPPTSTTVGVERLLISDQIWSKGSTAW